MSGKEREDMRGKIPKWEAKLWSKLSTGTGEYCPLRTSCWNKKQGHWCPCEHKEQIYKVFDKTEFDLKDFAFVTKGQCGWIFQMVYRLAQRYLKRGGVTNPPVPTELIWLIDEPDNIDIRLLPFRTYHGVIWHSNSKWIIQLNKNDTPQRNRFTLFHEAFHILAHNSSSAPVFRKIDKPYGSFNELLADYFAVSILMPEEWVVPEWVKYHDFNHMVKTFAVPEPSMCIRLKRLGLLQ